MNNKEEKVSVPTYRWTLINFPEQIYIARTFQAIQAVGYNFHLIPFLILNNRLVINSGFPH